MHKFLFKRPEINPVAACSAHGVLIGVILTNINRLYTYRYKLIFWIGRFEK
jgi:hypothetical protein